MFSFLSKHVIVSELEVNFSFFLLLLFVDTANAYILRKFIRVSIHNLSLDYALRLFARIDS
jgi:hypothetical protein